MCQLYKKGFFTLLQIILLLISGCDNDEIIHLQGYTEGEFIYLSSESSGRISHIAVVRGQQVSPGERLVTLDDDREKKQFEIAGKDLAKEIATLNNLEKGERESKQDVTRAKISKNRHDLKLSVSKLARFKQLNKHGYISAFELEQAETELKQQQSSLNELNSQLEHQKLPARDDEIQAQKARKDAALFQVEKSKIEVTRRTIFSPVSAQVYDIVYHEGEIANAGSPLITLLPDNALKIRFFVPSLNVNQVYPGKEIKVKINGVNEMFVARVEFISPKAEYTPPVVFDSKQKRMVFMVEAKSLQPQDGLRTGQPVEVYF